MPDPISFTTASPRYQLPLLFSGQAQKEFFVNEAHALIDTLLHPVIEGEADDPPADPAAGECWLVGASPTGDWAGQAGMLACFQADGWIFTAPRDGMRLFDRSAGRDLRYLDGWHQADPPAQPAGGSVIDEEARIAINGLINALVSAGILPQS
ncbi:hypothetical protein FHS61_000821 [Altererythrobacter atlanticus]|uniref:Uncharacterized protein n=1 Tax=Croceibacterium atlanticum TaxID=1267766 RepID=A0A0F7KXF5_9SPHN|nr:DUF2793 domain-containing protein [Croceibacterium atlanticum]AKH43475.1 hypothetical protein WYH_02445 [Croceibacterium atlanticum]MBB5731817.1 hypothetical protein [Croceibacterium atlanticum]